MTLFLKKVFRSIAGIFFVIIAVIILFLILDFVFQLPSPKEILAQLVVFEVSVVALIAFAGINLLFVINMLHATNVQQKKEQQVEQSKNELMSLVSHQLRTPISAVNWYTESLLSGDAGTITETERDYISRIRESNSRMVAMVDSMIHISQIELDTFAFTVQSVNVAEIIDQAIQELQFQAQHRSITIEKKYSTELENIQTDPQYLRLIADNLLLNAIKYSPEKTTVTITVERTKDSLNITVADHGYGIPADDQKKIFSKLFRAHNILDKDTDGMGLGLYMTKSIVNRIGGTITFTSTEGAGTTFYVTLPIKINSK